MLNNKWIRGAIPALLIHCSIGSVYAWSLFVESVAKHMGQSIPKVQFAFSLAIFFLGTSAAFGGKIVEHNIKKSAMMSAVCFTLGLVLTGYSIQYKSLVGLYIGYGVIMGIGLGIGYITPVKALMMWFKDNKGLATGIAITGFGFASSIASPIITFLITNTSLLNTFLILALIYLIPLILASILLKKPYENEQIEDNNFKYTNILKDKKFICVWFIMFLNITGGLALISSASPIMVEYNIPISTIAIVVSVMGIFNGLGRLVLSVLSDKLNYRISMYKFIFIASIFLAIQSFILLNYFNSIVMLYSLVATLCIISSTYGAGFSCLPTLLADTYGMQNISKIHGLCLTSWAIAGLVGNQISAFIKNVTGSYLMVFVAISLIYFIGIMFVFKYNKTNKLINTITK